MFVTATIAMIYWTSFVQGISIKPLVKLFGLKTSEEKNPTMNERINRRTMDHLVAGLEGVLGHQSRRGHRNLYNHIDHKYIKPWILRDTTARDQKILETFESKIQDDAVKFMKRNATTFTPFEMVVQKNKLEYGNISDKLDNVHGKEKGNIENVDPAIHLPIEVKIEEVDSHLPSRRASHMQVRRSITDPGGVDIGNLLSINLVEVPNRSRRLSERHWVQDVTSVMDLDVAEPVDHPTFTRHQLKEAAKKLTSGTMDTCHYLSTK